MPGIIYWFGFPIKQCQSSDSDTDVLFQPKYCIFSSWDLKLFSLEPNFNLI